MKGGQNHGVWRWWLEDGKTPLSEDPYKDGLRHGLAKGWDAKGRLWCETPYENGRKHGGEREWNSKGKLVWEMPYSNGQLHGVARYWKANAEMQAPFMKLFVKLPKPVSYWIEGQEVTEAQYLSASKTNAALPALERKR